MTGAGSITSIIRVIRAIISIISVNTTVPGSHSLNDEWCVDLDTHQDWSSLAAVAPPVHIYISTHSAPLPPAPP